MERLTFKFPSLTLANYAANAIRKNEAGTVVSSQNGFVIVETSDVAAVNAITGSVRGYLVLHEAVSNPAMPVRPANPVVARLVNYKVPMFLVKQYSSLKKKKDSMPGSRIMWSHTSGDNDLDVIPAKEVDGYLKSGWVIIENVNVETMEAEISESISEAKTKLTPDQLKKVNQGVKSKIIAAKSKAKEEVEEEEEEEIISEGGVKAAIEDFMYDMLPKQAIAELKPIMKNQGIRGADLRNKVTAVLKKHKVPLMYLGGSSAQMVIDYFDTFHGESVEVEEATVGYALVVNNKIVHRGNKQSCLKLAKEKHGGLKQGKVFITYTPKEVGDTFTKEEVEVTEAKVKYLTGPGKKDSKRLLGIYTMGGKWVKDMGSEAEAKAFVNKSWGESVEEEVEITEAPFKTNDLLDAIEKAYTKGGIRGVIEGGKEFGLIDKTTVQDIVSNLRKMFSKDSKYAAKDIKGYFTPQDYSKYVKEEVEVNEASWGGGFQSSREAQAEVQASLKADAKKRQMLIISALQQVIDGKMSKAAFNKLTGSSYDKIMKLPFYTKKVKMKKEEVAENAEITEEMVTESPESVEEAKAKTVQLGKATIKIGADGYQFFNYPGMSAAKRVPLMAFIAKAYGVPSKEVMTSPEAMKGFKLIMANLDAFNAWLKKNNMQSAFSGGMGYHGETLGWWLKNVAKKSIKGNYSKPPNIKEEVEIEEAPASFVSPEADLGMFGYSKPQFEVKMRQLIQRMGFEKGINRMEMSNGNMILYFANKAKAQDFMITFNGMIRRTASGSVAKFVPSAAMTSEQGKKAMGSEALVILDLSKMKKESVEFEAILQNLEEDALDEKLIGKQDKLDVNKNGKLDARDFKALRAKKAAKEEAEVNEAMNNYLAFYNGKKMSVQAETSYKAQLKAAAMFKVPANKQHMITVKLADNKAAFASNEAYAPLDTPGILGAFTETSKKKRFEYRKSTDKWGISHGLPHEVCVRESSPSEWRAANVKGTVCYIATDEGEGGKPVLDKWAISNHVKYVKAEGVMHEVEVNETAPTIKAGMRLYAKQDKKTDNGSVVKGQYYKVADAGNGLFDLIHQSMGYRKAMHKVTASQLQAMIQNKVF